MVFAVYLCSVTLITVIITVYDKIAAKKYPNNRVPEKTLLILGIIGGALGEYITMRVIHHKTKHNKFMIGLPVITVIQIILTAVYLFSQGAI